MTAQVVNFPTSRAHRRTGSTASASARDHSFAVGDRVLDTVSCCNGTVTKVAGSLYAVRLDGGTGVSRCACELLPPKPTTPAA
jgi:hypothetical protein